jgi:hypothetical protein
MSAINPKLKLIYVSVPKCACTSVKTVMFFLENNRGFQELTINGKKKYVHQFYPSRKFKETSTVFNNRYKELGGYTKFCVLRDPIERIVSAYKNRVIHFGELKEETLKKHGINPKLANPSFPQFVEHFFQYRKVPKIQHHTNELNYFLGTDPSYYDKIFNLKNISSLPEFIETKFKIKIDLPHFMTGGGGAKSIDLNKFKEEKPKLYQTLVNYTKKDYEIFSKFL